MILRRYRACYFAALCRHMLFSRGYANTVALLMGVRGLLNRHSKQATAKFLSMKSVGELQHSRTVASVPVSEVSVAPSAASDGQRTSDVQCTLSLQPEPADERPAAPQNRIGIRRGPRLRVVGWQASGGSASGSGGTSGPSGGGIITMSPDGAGTGLTHAQVCSNSASDRSLAGLSANIRSKKCGKSGTSSGIAADASISSAHNQLAQQPSLKQILSDFTEQQCTSGSPHLSPELSPPLVQPGRRSTAGAISAVHHYDPQAGIAAAPPIRSALPGPSRQLSLGELWSAPAAAPAVDAPDAIHAGVRARWPPLRNSPAPGGNSEASSSS